MGATKSVLRRTGRVAGSATGAMLESATGVGRREASRGIRGVIGGGLLALLAWGITAWLPGSPASIVLILLAAVAVSRIFGLGFRSLARACTSPVAGGALLIAAALVTLTWAQNQTWFPDVELPAGLWQFALLAVVAALIVAAVGERWGAGAKSRLLRRYGAAVAQILGVTEAALRETATLSLRKGTLSVSNPPAGAGLMLGRGGEAERRTGLVLPDFTLDPISSERQVRFVPVSLAVEEQRAQLAASNGLVIATKKVEGAQARPDQERWTLADDSPANGDRLAALASAAGLALVEFRPYERTAFVAALDADTTRLRAALVPFLGVKYAWDLELETVWDAGTLATVRFLRTKAIADPKARRDTHLAALKAVSQLADLEMWQLTDSTASDGTLTAVRRADPLAAVSAYPSDATPSFKAVPFAVAEDGRHLTLSVVETNFLIGGMPGGGKSGGLTALLAGISQLPNTAIIGLDPKRVEQALWSPRFSHIAKDPSSALETLKAVAAEMRRRYEWLEQAGKKKVSSDMLSAEMPLLVVVVDELADLATDPEHGQEIAETLRSCVALGRASGVVVVAATQKPTSDVVPTKLRDLIQQRVGYSTSGRESSIAIFGSGGEEVVPAHQIPPSMRGVCFILSEESRTPVRARTYWVPDEDVADMATATAHLRVPLPWLKTSASRPRGRGDVLDVPDQAIVDHGMVDLDVSFSLFD